MNHYSSFFKKKECILLIILLVIKTQAFGQNISPHQIDSLKLLVCELDSTDQAVRKDYEQVVADHDSTKSFKFDSALQATDFHNFKTLEKILIDYGYPGYKILGGLPRFKSDTSNLCGADIVLIHWAKEFPEWFTDAEMTTLFKKELDNGNLKLWQMDVPIFFYLAYADHGMECFSEINNARKIYGLPLYTEKQFMKIDPVTPLIR